MKQKTEKGHDPISELEATLKEWELKVRIEQMKSQHRELRRAANEDEPSKEPSVPKLERF